MSFDFEEQLVRRIAVREAFATLSPRHRAVITEYYRLGKSVGEIARDWHVSNARIEQIRQKAVDRLQTYVRRAAPPPRLPEPDRKPPLPEFDRAAFVGHMRWLLDERRRMAAAEAERERQRSREYVLEEAREALREQRGYEEAKRRQAEIAQKERAERLERERKQAEQRTQRQRDNDARNAAEYRMLLSANELKEMALRAHWRTIVAERGWTPEEAWHKWCELMTMPVGWPI